jgi:hypothetical protein
MGKKSKLVSFAVGCRKYCHIYLWARRRRYIIKTKVVRTGKYIISSIFEETQHILVARIAEWKRPLIWSIHHLAEV